MYRLAIYGKGGIGKSTTTSNVATALVGQGLTVLQIGCDPKSDSTILHRAGKPLPTVLDQMRACDEAPALSDLVQRAPDGVWCCEAGGPVPGVGCAGRGIITAFDELDKLRVYDEVKPDVVLYDVLGDVVCGGFAMPLRGKYSDGVMVVTSGEMMSLYAAGNIMQAIEGFKTRGYAEFRGLIANLRNVPDETAKIDAFCEEQGCRVVATIPRTSLIQDAEAAGVTAVTLFPESELAALYTNLASAILQADN